MLLTGGIELVTNRLCQLHLHMDEAPAGKISAAAEDMELMELVCTVCSLTARYALSLGSLIGMDCNRWPLRQGCQMLAIGPGITSPP